MTSLGKINKRQNLNDCVQLQDIKQRDFILFQSPPSIFMADGNTSNHVIYVFHLNQSFSPYVKTSLAKNGCSNRSLLGLSSHKEKTTDCQSLLKTYLHSYSQLNSTRMTHRETLRKSTTQV